MPRCQLGDYDGPDDGCRIVAGLVILVMIVARTAVAASIPMTTWSAIGAKVRGSDDGDEMKDEPQIMTLGEIADFLKVHRSTLYRLIKQRKLPVFRIGSDYRARRADLMEWMQAQTDNAGGTPTPR